MLTAYGVLVLTFMTLMYALERRGPKFVLAFPGDTLAVTGEGAESHNVARYLRGDRSVKPFSWPT